MVDPERKTILVKADNGDEKEFDILFSFHTDEPGKEYVVFTDYSPTDMGTTSLHAATYHPEDPEQTLSPILEEEWDMVYHVLDQMQKQLA